MLHGRAPRLLSPVGPSEGSPSPSPLDSLTDYLSKCRPLCMGLLTQRLCVEGSLEQRRAKAVGRASPPSTGQAGGSVMQDPQGHDYWTTSSLLFLSLVCEPSIPSLSESQAFFNPGLQRAPGRGTFRWPPHFCPASPLEGGPQGFG